MRVDGLHSCIHAAHADDSHQTCSHQGLGRVRARMAVPFVHVDLLHVDMAKVEKPWHGMAWHGMASVMIEEGV